MGPRLHRHRSQNPTACGRSEPADLRSSHWHRRLVAGVIYAAVAIALEYSDLSGPVSKIKKNC